MYTELFSVKGNRTVILKEILNCTSSKGFDKIFIEVLYDKGHTTFATEANYACVIKRGYYLWIHSNNNWIKGVYAKLFECNRKTKVNDERALQLAINHKNNLLNSFLEKYNVKIEIELGRTKAETKMKE